MTVESVGWELERGRWKLGPPRPQPPAEALGRPACELLKATGSDLKRPAVSLAATEIRASPSLFDTSSTLTRKTSEQPFNNVDEEQQPGLPEPHLLPLSSAVSSPISCFEHRLNSNNNRNRATLISQRAWTCCRNLSPTTRVEYR